MLLKGKNNVTSEVELNNLQERRVQCITCTFCHKLMGYRNENKVNKVVKLIYDGHKRKSIDAEWRDFK